MTERQLKGWRITGGRREGGADALLQKLSRQSLVGTFSGSAVRGGGDTGGGRNVPSVDDDTAPCFWSSQECPGV